MSAFDFFSLPGFSGVWILGLNVNVLVSNRIPVTLDQGLIDLEAGVTAVVGGRGGGGGFGFGGAIMGNLGDAEWKMGKGGRGRGEERRGEDISSVCIFKFRGWGGERRRGLR